MSLVIIKYNAGNVFSLRMALERLGCQAVISDDPKVIRKAERIIFPGVGEASSAMKYLTEKGLTETLTGITRPFLGICLGLQLMCRHSEENNTRGLGIFPVSVKKFPPLDKVPHVGWNSLQRLQGSLFNHVDEGSYVYFVHSYFASVEAETAAETTYIEPFSAALQKDNFFAVQFHPEKSGATGEQILRNFLKQ